jgi:hypothetical protein
MRYALPQSHCNVPTPRTAPVYLIYETNTVHPSITANSSNTYSYIWNATRDHYRESGCVFELEPLYGDGSWLAPNFTSPFFAADMRYAGDPGPTDWNFGGLSASTISAMVTPMPTSSASASDTASAAPQSGLGPAQKAGIGVGVSLGVLLLCLLGFLFIRYKRRLQNNNNNRNTMERPDPVTEADINPPTPSTSHHISGTETLFPELSAQNYDDGISHKQSSVQRPISKLMASPPRVELE